MLRELLYPLSDTVTFFRIFKYLTFRSAYAAVSALLLTFLLGPVMINALRRLKAGQSIREDGPQTHISKSGTPTMGGLLIIGSILLSVLLWMDLHSLYAWLALASLIGFGIVGFLDDLLKIFKKNSDGLSAKLKLIGQLTLSTVIVLFIYFNRNEYTTLLYLPFLKNPVLDLGVLYIPFAVLLLAFWSNAVNLTDGLDGLATGLIILVGITISVLTYVAGRGDFSEYLQIPYILQAGELTVIGFALVGASIGFLWYNSHPAEIFMGDTGSLSLGGLLGIIALLIKKEILLLVTGGVFVLEIVSVIIQVLCYKISGKRVFRMAPLHHHFELKGWDESKVVMRFWILGGLFTILSLSTLKLQ
ncbi:MAG: phospho-N-acetylmuramoyl-pentapeptide-transferase [Spirochaetales bacterium]|nr:phospho-N-acetylmuramoyl-pentapeptide-transferase [Spirochaetales bacterium]